MLRRVRGAGRKRGVDVQRYPACAYELGEDEFGWGVGAVGGSGGGLPIWVRQEFAGLHLRCGALGAGETVGDLHDDGREARGACASRIGAGALEIVDLAQ